MRNIFIIIFALLCVATSCSKVDKKTQNEPKQDYRHRSWPTESYPLHPVSGFKGRHLVAQTMSKGDEPTV